MGHRRGTARAGDPRRPGHELRLSRRCGGGARRPLPGGDLPAAGTHAVHRAGRVHRRRGSGRHRRGPGRPRVGHRLPGGPLLGRPPGVPCCRRHPWPPRGCVVGRPARRGRRRGLEAFAAEMLARVPEASRDRARALDEKDTAGEATAEEALEAFSLFWASYFADPPAAPPMPRIEFSQPANLGLWAASDDPSRADLAGPSLGLDRASPCGRCSSAASEPDRRRAPGPHSLSRSRIPRRLRHT